MSKDRATARRTEEPAAVVKWTIEECSTFECHSHILKKDYKSHVPRGQVIAGPPLRVR